MKILVCIPSYGNGGTIAAVVAGALRSGQPVLVVDDGSTDATAQNARAAGAMVISHPHNRGKGEALKTACAYARAHAYSHVLSIDADGQHEPDDIPKLVALSQQNPLAIVLGVRDFRAMPKANRFGNRFSNFWVNLAMRRSCSDTQCGLRVYPLALLDEQKFRGTGYEFETEALIWHARKQRPLVSVPVRVYYPQERVSHFQPWRDARRIVLLVMRFLFLPSSLWIWLLLCTSACAARIAREKPSADRLDAQQKALAQTALPFTASQHLRYRDGRSVREANALFIVYPGRGFRLRVLGPMLVTVFDVSVRCGRFMIEERNKSRGGMLSEADTELAFFPLVALQRALQPLATGTWEGDTTFVSRAGVRAELEPGREVFSHIDVGEQMHLHVLQTQRIGGVMMPKKMRVDLSRGRSLDIDNADIGFDVPREDDALSPVICKG